MSRHRGVFSQRFVDLKREYDEKNACPICVHLNKWFDDSPVMPVTHGWGGTDADGQWKSWKGCYEHYRVLSAYRWTEGF